MLHFAQDDADFLFLLNILYGYCSKISHGDSQGLIAARRAGEDFDRSHGAGGNSNNGRTAHPTPPEIPLRLRLALSGKSESSTALRMTRAAAHKTFTRTARRQAILCLCFLPWGSITHAVKVLGGLGDFFKSPPNASPRPFNTRPLR